jgi:DNA invertase Pin-like site-specific DNA recombinase
MVFHKKKKFSEKHPQKEVVGPEIKNQIYRRSNDGMISCATAFKIAGEQNISPHKIGITIDLLNIRITKCQLGLFGYKPKKKLLQQLHETEPDLQDAIIRALAKGRLSCNSAWTIATQFNVSKITVSSTCEFLGIKINDCQLGAF